MNTPLPTPRQLKEQLPITEKQAAFIDQARKAIADILEKRSSRQLLIVGPCSLHDLTAAREYALHLKKLASDVKDTFYLVMRTYFEKSRTGLGWQGFLTDPHLDGTYDPNTGIWEARQFLLELAEMEVPAGMEFVTPTSASYLKDLISWGSIGARTATSQPHRHLASSLPMPIGIKNTIDGAICNAVNGCVVASRPCRFFGVDEEGQKCFTRSKGNPYTHVVLRGGKESPNYHPEAIQETEEKLAAANLPVRLLIDCSHDNSRKNYERQTSVFHSVFTERARGNTNIAGMLLESHLNESSQELAPPLKRLNYGVSITDPCLSFESTRKMILWARERTNKHVETTI